MSDAECRYLLDRLIEETNLEMIDGGMNTERPGKLVIESIL